MSRKRRDVCLSCLDRYGCTRMGLKPSIGECSFVRTGRRMAALGKILDAVRRKGTCFLKRTVDVTQDFCGMDFKVSVRLVRPYPGVLPESLRFGLGKDAHGEEVSTEDVSTEDLERILQEI